MDKQVEEITRAVMRLYDDVTHCDALGRIDFDRVREHFGELHDALYARQDPPTLSPGAESIMQHALKLRDEIERVFDL